MAVSLADQYRISARFDAKFLSQNMQLLAMTICIGGVAIWCMHFVGMSAMTLYKDNGELVRSQIDPLLTVLSLLCSLTCVYVGLYFSSRDRVYSQDRATVFNMLLEEGSKRTMQDIRNPWVLWRMALLKGIDKIALGGLITAAGVCTMHYMGMTAVVVDADIEWNVGVVTVSVLIAMVAATAAFWILFRVLPMRPELEILRILASIIAAIAVCGMHYTGMAAATYKYNPGNAARSTLSSPVDMTTAGLSGLGAGMLCLWIFVMFIFADLRSWHLALSNIVGKTDVLVEDLKKSTSSNESFIFSKAYSELRKSCTFGESTNGSLMGSAKIFTTGSQKSQSSLCDVQPVAVESVAV